jgi:hypothetical protein
MLFVYHMFFQFTVAIATGTLFVAATNRYYQAGLEANRGHGYATELVGSAIGALFAMTLILPAIGLQWLLASVGGLLLLALAGSILTARGEGV